MKRPRALDLFTGAGGVAVGLQRAGFDVTGVDIAPQPHHRGGHFIQADALAVLQEIDFLLGFDFICGLALGLRTKRHRYFEASFALRGTECPPGHPGDWVTVCGGGGPRLVRVNAKTPARAVRVAEGRAAMGIDWMNRAELAQAIPPAYAEFIGRRALEVIQG